MSREHKIWLSTPHIGSEEEKFVKETLEANLFSPFESKITSFENELVKYTSTGAAAALTSGTAAIHLALILSGVSSGDEVLCSSFTFSASCNPIVYLKASPVFIDSETSTWNLDPVLLEETILDRIKKGKKPKALILVHLYGFPSQLDEIVTICKNYNIKLIEDAAEALGATYKGKHLGTFGDFGVLSFNNNKIITTSGGGALISNDKTLVEKSRYLATQARDPAPHYEHSQIGYNYRMNNVSASIGLGQMLVLKQRVEQRRNIFNYYKAQLENVNGIIFQTDLEGFYSNRWLTCLTFKEEGVNHKVRVALDKENIEARPLWKPMHLQPVFKDCPAYTNGVSEDLFARGLCLPSSSYLTQEDLDCVIDIIKTTLD